MRDGPADPIAGPSGRGRVEEPEAPKVTEGEKGGEKATGTGAETVKIKAKEECAQGAQTPSADPPSPLPTPTVLPTRPPPAHPFDTFAFVSHLAASDISRPTARTLMEAVRATITHRTGIAQTRMLSREEMDNDAYRFKAALSDIRTGHSVRSRRDGVALRAAASAIRREVDGLEQKIKEDIGVMRHDIEIETNNRKAETRSDMKRFDIAREEINNKFTISLGDLRTEIEGAKWDATRRAIAIILTLVIIGVVLSSMGSKPAVPVPPAKPAMVDAGVGPEDEDGLKEAEEELDRLLSEVEERKRRQVGRHEAEGRI
ncbi:uncharacterized protein COLE_06925 [Cutaneotrichosporon oleaginosum]|nr:hypothetical protein COLE_06925 [Cutaneotrichosporon oleaginosum]